MKNTVFYSWQADTPAKTGRNLIEEALKSALKAVSADTAVEQAIRENLELDKDTSGVPGSPPIVETIVKKIGGAAVFVGDVTFVGDGLNGKRIPNPNVLIEYGCALKSLTSSRIVQVMNTAHGEPKPESMPFNLRHIRFPITYELSESADSETRASVRKQLAKDLEGALKRIFQSAEFKSLVAPKPAAAFPRQEPVVGSRARFRPPERPIGFLENSVDELMGRAAKPLPLAPGPAQWLRVMPNAAQERKWPIAELKKNSGALYEGILGLPGNLGAVRADDGYGVCILDGAQSSPAISFAFRTGEVWTIDTSFAPTEAVHGLERSGGFFLYDEERFALILKASASFLKLLGIAGPYQWIAGIEGVEGSRPVVERLLGGKQFKAFMAPFVEVPGEYSLGQKPGEALAPFFEEVLDQCVVSRAALMSRA